MDQTPDIFLHSCNGIAFWEGLEPHEIMALDTALEDMSGEGNAALWTEDALRLSDAWAEIRRLARACLSSLGLESG